MLLLWGEEKLVKDQLIVVQGEMTVRGESEPRNHPKRCGCMRKNESGGKLRKVNKAVHQAGSGAPCIAAVINSSDGGTTARPLC